MYIWCSGGSKILKHKERNKIYRKLTEGGGATLEAIGGGDNGKITSGSMVADRQGWAVAPSLISHCVGVCIYIIHSPAVIKYKFYMLYKLQTPRYNVNTL